jgi:hypothetical protein
MKEEDTTDSPQSKNVNHGDNEGRMERVSAGGDVTQQIEIGQSATSGGSVEVSDPNNQNRWISACEQIAQLPLSEPQTRLGLFGGGAISWVLAVLLALTPWNGLWNGVQSVQFPILLGTAGTILLGFGFAYRKAVDIAACPECGAEFAMYTTAVRKKDRTEISNGNDVIHGERDRECAECGHTETENEEWTPGDFKRAVKRGSIKNQTLL